MDQVQILIDLTEQRRVFNSVLLASFVVTAVDHFHTFPAEVRLVWPRQWSLVKVLFLFSRYLPWIYGPLMINKDVASQLELQECRPHMIASSLTMMTAILLAQAIMFIRVYAICGRGKKLLCWLIFQYIGIHAAAFAFLILFHMSFQYIPSPIPSIMACLPINPDTSKLATVYAILMASETVILIISMVGFWSYRQNTTRLLSTLRKDGLVFYVLLVCLSIANLIFDAKPPKPSMRFMLSTPLTISHSVLSCRFVLHLYKITESETMSRLPESSTDPKSFIQFAKPRATTDTKWVAVHTSNPSSSTTSA
ncbi:hypothetical protein FA15DRAFT_462683 [Coprinopsis marcescibilis]|uniref:DUF6533 domain-containing protein n=1 Tax=Coprinopsis marcescibilis TaxID=230819 RepID=A0A5C3KST1_COPMA|nr:hypothetical protein FA15DRAFT_462683 [Coprinopsis marcescibilis]